MTAAGPTFPFDSDFRRIRESRLRRRILYGEWREDLNERIRLEVKAARADAWGEPDMSVCHFRAKCAALSTLYDAPPLVEHGDAAGQDLVRLVSEAGYWQLMQRHQRDVLGQREGAMRVAPASEIPGPDGLIRPVYQRVFADLMDASADARDPSSPTSWWLAKKRQDPSSGRWVWTWDQVDSEARTYRVWDDRRETDLTSVYLGGTQSGEAYPFVDSEDVAVLDGSLYHAQHTGVLWDPFEWKELVEITLRAGVLWTMWAHCVRDASWPQRYTIGLTLGHDVTGTSENGAPRRVTADPAAVLQFVQEMDATTSTVGQWQAASDPEALARAIADYERRAAISTGMAPSDFRRVDGDPRSGYAMSITSEGQRKAQKRFAPTFQRSDEEMLRITAIVLNRAHGEQRYPESGYRVQYRPVLMDGAELAHYQALVADGLMDRAQVMMAVRPSLDRGEAVRELRRIQAANRALSADRSGPNERRADGDGDAGAGEPDGGDQRPDGADRSAE